MRLLLLVSLCLFAAVVHASHFRYGYCSWENDPDNDGTLRKVSVQCRSAWRYDSGNPNRECGAASLGGGYGSNECPCINVNWVGTLYEDNHADGPSLCRTCGTEPPNCLSGYAWTQVAPFQRTDPVPVGGSNTFYTEWVLNYVYTYPSTVPQQNCYTIGYYAGARLSPSQGLQNGADQDFLVHSSISLSSKGSSPRVLEGDPLVKTFPISATGRYRIRVAPFQPNAEGTGFRCHHDPTQEPSGSNEVPRAQIQGRNPVVTDDCVIEWDSRGGVVGNRYVIRVHAHQEPNYNYDGTGSQVACELAAGFDFLFALTNVNSDISCTQLPGDGVFTIQDIGHGVDPCPSTPPPPSCCSTSGQCCANNDGDAIPTTNRYCGSRTISFQIHNDLLCNDIVSKLTHTYSSTVGVFQQNPAANVPVTTGNCNTANDGGTVSVTYTPPAAADVVAGETFTGDISIEDVVYGLQASCPWTFTVPQLITGQPDIGVFTRHVPKTGSPGNYISITNGDTTPTEAEGTDIGGSRVSYNPITMSYATGLVDIIIANVGDSALDLSRVYLSATPGQGTSCGVNPCLGFDWWVEEADIGRCASSPTTALTCTNTPTGGKCIDGTFACSLGIGGCPGSFPTDQAGECNTMALRIHYQAQDLGLRQVYVNIVSDDPDEGTYSFIVNVVGVDPEIAVQDFQLTTTVQDNVPFDLSTLRDVPNNVFHVGQAYPMRLYVVNEFRAAALTLLQQAIGGSVTVFNDQTCPAASPCLITEDAEITSPVYPANTGNNKIDVHIGAHVALFSWTYTPSNPNPKTFQWRINSDDTTRDNEGAAAGTAEGFFWDGATLTNEGFQLLLTADPVEILPELLPPTTAPDPNTPIPCDSMPTRAAGTRFPGALIGSAPVVQTFRLRNTGEDTWSITDIQVVPTGIFTVSQTTYSVTSAGGILDLVITMATGTAGAHTANITILDNSYATECLFQVAGLVAFFDITSPTASSVCYMYFPCTLSWSTNMHPQHVIDFYLHSRSAITSGDPEYIDRFVWQGDTGVASTTFRNYRLFPRMYYVYAHVVGYNGPADGDDFTGVAPPPTAEFRIWSSQECRFGGGC